MSQLDENLVLMRNQLTAAMRLNEVGLTRLANDYYQQLAASAQIILDQSDDKRLTSKVKSLLKALEHHKQWRINYHAARLQNYLLDSQAKRNGPLLMTSILLCLVMIGSLYYWYRMGKPSIAADEIVVDHSNYNKVNETAKRYISSWIEVGRPDDIKSQHEREGSPEEYVGLDGFTESRWWHLNPPVVNWFIKSKVDKAKIEFFFPEVGIVPDKLTSVGLFLTDGDVSMTIPRIVRLKASGIDKIVSPQQHGLWVEFPVSEEERFKRTKTIELIRLSGDGIAVSAVVFWREKK